MMRSTRVVLVDSQPIFRAGVRRVIEETGRYQVVAEAGTVLEASHLGEAHDFDLIVLNAHLPVMVGIHVARLLARRQATPRIVFLGNDRDRDTMAAAARVGAAAVLPRDTSPAELVRVLNRVVADESTSSATQAQDQAGVEQGRSRPENAAPTRQAAPEPVVEPRQRSVRRPIGDDDSAPAERPGRRHGRIPSGPSAPGTASPMV